MIPDPHARSKPPNDSPVVPSADSVVARSSDRASRPEAKVSPNPWDKRRFRETCGQPENFRNSRPSPYSRRLHSSRKIATLSLESPGRRTAAVRAPWSTSSMSQPFDHPGVARNLLFGILALQMNFIGRDALWAPSTPGWATRAGRSHGSCENKDTSRRGNSRLSMACSCSTSRSTATTPSAVWRRCPRYLRCGRCSRRSPTPTSAALC